MIVYGKNAVMEALRNNITINKMWVEKTNHDNVGEEIISLAKERRLKISFEKRDFLTHKVSTAKHQGFVADITEFVYSSTREILELAKKREELPFVVILDSIADPHNLGAIIRTAESAGVHGIILQKDRACPVNETVYKTSAGAISNMLIARVVNISQEIEFLKKQGLWIYGLELGGVDFYKTNLTGPIAIVIGSEGEGIRALVKKNCDNVLTLPMRGQVNSLNASVAGGVAIYEILRQRI